MIEARIAKLLMIACLAAFAALVTFNNLADYGANFEFVRHVLSMDTTFPENGLLYRGVTNPALWNAAYCLIIFAEGLTALGFAVAAAALLRELRADALGFNRAKRFTFVAAGLGFVVWFFGFIVIGGEWFLMWQSHSWNGQEAAFRFYLTILAVLIFVGQKDDDLMPGKRERAWTK